MFIATTLFLGCTTEIGLDPEDNEPPTVKIVEPADGMLVGEGVFVAFLAQVGDPNDENDTLDYHVASSLQEGISASPENNDDGTVSFGLDTLEVGVHQITFTATDPDGASDDDTTEVQVVANQPPSVVFTSPTDDQRFAYGYPVEVSVTVTDLDESDIQSILLSWGGAALVAEPDENPTSTGEVHFFIEGLDIGGYSIEVTAEDSLQDVVESGVAFAVVDGDVDGDSWLDTSVGGDDCDDSDPAVYVGATEICDGADNDCDGEIDEEAVDASDWYIDNDADAYGHESLVETACEAPLGYTSNADDCDDASAAVNPGAAEWCDGIDNDCDGTVDEGDAADATTWHTDADGDGYGDPDSFTSSCDTVAGAVANDDDCDDVRDTIFPDADELCNDLDDDCDGTIDEDHALDAKTWYLDLDSDGYGGASTATVDCDEPSGYLSDGSDCDDTDDAVNPAESERCNGIDDDCDGTIDVDAIDAETYHIDNDGDGYGHATLSVEDCDAPSGYTADSSDCEDADADINPGAAERCDGVDNDCDGDTDENDAIDVATWYQDVDGDSFGDASSAEAACSGPGGWVADGSDCDDTRALTYPGAIEFCNGVDDDCDSAIDEDEAADASYWYIDLDGDGFGGSDDSELDCDQPSGFIGDGSDCDDDDEAVYPGADEVCDGIDNDCDGDIDADAIDATTWYVDSDEDGYGHLSLDDEACEQPSGFVADGNDCDDASASINPGAAEYCDGVDNNCDGEVDEDAALDASSWYFDGDGDTYGDALAVTAACEAPPGYLDDDTDCDDDDDAVHPGAEERCNGIDDDCDTAIDEDSAIDVATWYLDNDDDGYGIDTVTETDCDEPEGYASDEAVDCDDDDDTIYPGADELCDGVDNNCDGGIDEDSATDAPTWYADTDTDTYGADETATTACDAPDTDWTETDGDCDDDAALVNPSAAEVCDDVDNNCDGSVDEDSATDATPWLPDVDSDGFGDESGVPIVACDAPSGHVEDDTDCDDTDGAVFPGADEYCNGVDDDCNGDVDDGEPVDAPTWYTDIDGDGYGDPDAPVIACDQPTDTVTDDTDCDDREATAYPGLEEVCDDNTDNDCDGLLNEGCPKDVAELGNKIYSNGTYLQQLSAVASAGDVDGDGIDELVLGGHRNSGTNSLGDVFLTPSPGSGSAFLDDAPAHYTGNVNSRFGTWVAGGSDIDGDGIPDFAGVIPGTNGGLDGVYIFSGAVSASGSAWDQDLAGLTSSEPDGSDVAFLDDYDGDGLGAVVMGAHNAGFGPLDGGVVFVMKGGFTGDIDLDDEAYASISGANDEDHFGISVASVGDTDGDGVPDLLVGADEEDTGGDQAGSAYLFTDMAGTMIATYDAAAVYTGEETDDLAGRRVSDGGDANADGYSDMLISAPGDDSGASNGGAVYLVLGGAAPGDTDLKDASAKLVSDADDDGGASSGAYDYKNINALGADLDNDGTGDLVAGVPRRDGVSDNLGAVYVVLGPVTGILDIEPAATVVLYGEASSSSSALGRDLARGDFDGDGWDDVVVTSPNEDFMASNGGAAYILYGADLFGE